MTFQMQNQNQNQKMNNPENQDSLLMNRIPEPDFLSLDHDTLMKRVSLARSDRYYHLSEEAQKKKSSGRKKKSSSEKSTGSKKSAQAKQDDALKSLEKLSPEQREKLKKELGLCWK